MAQACIWNNWICYYCRTVADKTNKLESTVEVYRKKLEDLNDFRRQVKILQETNMMYMHNTVSLEEELKKANAARSQLETYKRQVRNVSFHLVWISVFSLYYFSWIKSSLLGPKKLRMKSDFLLTLSLQTFFIVYINGISFVWNE